MSSLSPLDQFVLDNKSLFWGVAESKLSSVSEEVVVETILNYGSLEAVKQLIDILGLERVAVIFNKQQSQARTNYSALTKNYFNLYFNRHAPRHS
jgi:hypothetical protein